jgi:hypothetical protein
VEALLPAYFYEAKKGESPLEGKCRGRNLVCYKPGKKKKETTLSIKSHQIKKLHFAPIRRKQTPYLGISQTNPSCHLFMKFTDVSLLYSKLQ